MDDITPCTICHVLFVFEVEENDLTQMLQRVSDGQTRLRMEKMLETLRESMNRFGDIIDYGNPHSAFYNKNFDSKDAMGLWDTLAQQVEDSSTLREEIEKTLSL